MSNSASIRRWTFIRDGSARKEHTKSEQASCCAAIVEPSPTGRDASGLLSRKVTGEVSEAAAAYRNTQSADDTEHSKSNSWRNVRASNPSAPSSGAGADRLDATWCRRRA